MGTVKEAAPYVGMVSVQFIVVGIMVAIKEATSSGMTKFTFVFYSNALASLLLLPAAFLLHRSPRPQITFSVLCQMCLLALFGLIAQVTGNVAIQITPVSFSASIMNLGPGFTFILLVIFRMEEVSYRSSSTLAKSIGTLVSVGGALIVTLYEGPSILRMPSLPNASDRLLRQPSNLLIGGLLLVIDCMASSAYIIQQALLLKKFEAELIIVFFYCFFCAIMSAILSLVLERDLASWSLQPTVRWLSLLYSGVIGSATQVSIIAWCMRKRGPLFIAVFHPLGIVVAAAVDIVLLGDTLHLGSLMGYIVIVLGFYAVMWGKAQERKVIRDNGVSSSESTETNVPLLQNIKEAQV